MIHVEVGQQQGEVPNLDILVIINDFQDVFPYVILSLSPNIDIEFSIDLVRGVFQCLENLTE